MARKLFLISVLSCFTISAFADKLPFGPIHYEALETISSPEVDQFVNPRNDKTTKALEQVSGFQAMQSFVQAEVIKSQERKKTKATVRGDYAYNYYRDDVNPKGIYRKTSKDAYLAAKKKDDFSGLRWETIVDIDAFIKSNKFPDSITDPSFGGWNCRYDTKTRMPIRCLVGFSNSGGDAKLYYEFDIETKTWIQKNGFNFPVLSRSSLSWVDADTMIVTLDGLSYHNAQHPDAKIENAEAVQKGLITKSGYPRHAYIWKRGDKFVPGNPIASVEVSSSSVHVASGKWNESTPEDRLFFIYDVVDFNNYVIYIKQDIDQDGVFETMKMDLPLKKSVYGMTEDHYFIFQTKEAWNGFNESDVISIHLKHRDGKIISGQPELIYRNTDPLLILSSGYVANGEEFDSTDDKIYLTLSKDVSNEALVLSRVNGVWTQQKFNDPLGLKYKSMHMWEDDSDKTLHMYITSFLVPSTEYVIRQEDGKTVYEVVDRDVEWFDASAYKVEQLWVDMGLDQNGKEIKVPYFIVYNPSLVKLENNKEPAPTRVSAYGGFKVGYNPFYMSSTGKFWLDEGGVYVLANIRGGDEFGDYWHTSAILEHKDNSYKDLIAISEDLIRRGITSPQKLAIEGGSNGGLLVGAVATMRPDLFKAVISSVPLLDMSRYHHLLVGASWMDEYGDPEGALKNFWSQFSPLHQLQAGVQYPRFFIKTNRNDDRVHPAHARKFSARLTELGVDHDYYEDLKGGHGGVAMTSAEQAYRFCLDLAFLYRELGMKSTK